MLLRFAVPVVFFGAAWYVHAFNTNNAQQKLLFPLVGLVPGYESLEAQATLSWQILLVLALLLTVRALVNTVRGRRAREEDEA